MKISTNPTWEDAKGKSAYPALKGQVEADVIIIGAGLAGIMSAYLLAEAGKKVVVLEKKGEILCDTTFYTTAFITNVLDTELAELIKIYGEKNAKLAWESHRAAIDEIQRIIKKEKIDCEFKRVTSFMYVNNMEEFEKLETEFLAMQKLGFEAALKKKFLKGFRNFGALAIKNQAKFHPIKFGRGLAAAAARKGVQIYTQTDVTDFKKTKNGNSIEIKGKNFKLTAPEIIVCTYKPIKLLKTFAKKGMYQSYVLEVEIPKDLIADGLYEDTENPYHYFRVDNLAKKGRMLLGGEDHREELRGLEKKSFKALEEYLRDLLGDRKYQITRKWTGPILEPTDGLALIGESKPGQFVATAFSGNGMTYSAIAAMIFKDLLTRKKNPWAALYDPKRVPSIKQLAYKARDYTQEMIQGAGKNIFR